MSWRRALLNGLLRRVEKPHLAREQDPLRLRAGFERRAPLIFRMPRGVASRWIDLLGVPALHLGPPIGAGPVMFYLHGGAFVMGSPRTHAAMVARLVQLTGCPAVLPRYRLAPEHPFPAAIKDTRAAYRGLCAGGVPVEIRVERDLPHVWPIFWRYLPEADATLKGVAGWIRQRWHETAES